MIGKQIKGRGFRGCLNYLFSKPEAELIGGNMAGDNPRTLAAEFKFSRQLNQNVKRPVYHASLSLPHRERLDDSRWNALAGDYLKQMGFTDNQYVLVRHSDREHDHVHIVASRIRLDGSCVHDGWDYRRSETVLRRLEQDYNLEAVKPSWETERRGKTSGQMRQQEDRENKAGLLPTPSVKQQIQNIADRVIQQCATPEQFIEKIKESGVDVQLRTRRDGSISGISYQYELPGVATVATSGTKLGTGYTWNGIQRRIQELSQQRSQLDESEGTQTQLEPKAALSQEQLAQLTPQPQTVPDSFLKKEKLGAKSQESSKKFFVLPVKDDRLWLDVRQYLVESRSLPSDVIDELHNKGVIYADSKRNAVFLKTDGKGTVTGAQLLGTFNDRPFEKTLSGAVAKGGWFRFVTGTGTPARVVLASSPTDALAAAALEIETKDATLYMSLDTLQPKDISLLTSFQAKGGRIEAAFNRDRAGNVLAEQLLTTFPGTVRRRPTLAPSWSDELRYLKSRERLGEAVKRLKERDEPSLPGSSDTSQKVDERSVEGRDNEATNRMPQPKHLEQKPQPRNSPEWEIGD